MKKLILLSAIAMSSLVYNPANAQIRFRFGFHFGPARVIVQTPPVVAYNEPVSYNGDEDYYYLPDLDAYYSVPEQRYYYMDGGQWVSAAYLPGAYHDFDWRYARHYEVRASRPYMHYDYYRSRYNGVAFNGRWDHFDNRNYHGYANDDHFNHNQFNRNDQRFDQNRGQYRPSDQNHNDGNWGGRPANDNHYNNRPDNNRNGGNDQHFAQNNMHGNDRFASDNHRPGRF